MDGARLTSASFGVAIALLIGGCAAAPARSSAPPTETGSAPVEAGREARSEPVEVVAYVMSKCPYAAEALASLVPVARAFGEGVALRLEYVGRDEDGELASMHGEGEVTGDMLQLCAREVAGYGPWLDFLECQVGTFEAIPEGWEACAAQAGVDADRLRLCVDGGVGHQLLAASFAHAEAESIAASPTVLIGGAAYRGGRTELAFARGLCSRLGWDTPVCEQVPRPPEVDVIVLADGRCEDPGCDVLEAVRRSREEIAGAKVTHVDYGQAEGRRLFDELGLKLLPVLLVGTAVERDESGYRFVRGFDVLGDYYATQLGRFDPVAGAWVPRLEFAVKLLVDERCTTSECEGVHRFEDFVARQAPGAKVASVDYGTPEGRALWKVALSSEPPRAGGADEPLGLPIAFFGQGFTEEELYYRLERRLRRSSDQLLFQLGAWDPTAEICDNGVDDDGDRRVDCRDPGCRAAMACRPEKARRLDLFAMSHCPFAVRVLREMGEVLDTFGRAQTEVDFHIQLIGTATDGGDLRSMHGLDEVEEDLRWVCVQHLYPRDHAFMEYVSCRVDEEEGLEWESCVPQTMDVEAIRSCAGGPVGQRLLRESFALAKALDITASPTWVLNNHLPMEGRTADAILAAFCEANASPECETLPPPAPAEPAGACQ